MQGSLREQLSRLFAAEIFSSRTQNLLKMQSFRAGAGVVWGLKASPHSGYNCMETCSQNKQANCFNDHDEVRRRQKKHLEMECLSRLEKIVLDLL